jgi:hypothetical protein
LGYLKLFDTAVQKLTTVAGNVWRGAIRDMDKDFNEDDEFTWWSVNSCSTSVKVIENFVGPNSTIFMIETLNGKDISKYTSYMNETEMDGGAKRSHRHRPAPSKICFQHLFIKFPVVFHNYRYLRQSKSSGGRISFSYRRLEETFYTKLSSGRHYF